MTGLPGVAMRFGISREGLAIAVQIVGKWQAESTVLHIAALLESVSPVRGPHPALRGHEASRTPVARALAYPCAMRTHHDKPRSNRTAASSSQLDLPFARPGTAHELAHDLAFYLGLCTLFAAHHKRWPSAASTREEFRSARVPDYDGGRIERELRFPGAQLEADPAYEALRERCLADGDGVGIVALDPRYRSTLQLDEVAGLLDTLSLPGDAGAGTVRYATGQPAHAEDELTLRPGDAVRARALARAGLDPANARVRAAAYALRARATAPLRSFMERIGMAPLPMHERLADHYLLVADDEGRLSIQYQLLAGARYVGRFDVEHLVAKLAAVYAASATLASLPAA